jgi:hypothetical protein
MEKNRWQTNCLFIKKIFVSIVDLFFPFKCLKCQKIILKTDQNYQDSKEFPLNVFGKYFCEDCISPSYEPFEPPFCKRCGKKFEHKFTLEKGGVDRVFTISINPLIMRDNSGAAIRLDEITEKVLMEKQIDSI